MLYLQLVVEVVVEAEEVEVGLVAAVVVVPRAMVVVLHMGLLHLPTAAVAVVTAMDVRLTCSSVMHQVLEFWLTVMQPSLLQQPDAACFFCICRYTSQHVSSFGPLWEVAQRDCCVMSFHLRLMSTQSMLDSIMCGCRCSAGIPSGRGWRVPPPH